MTKMTNSVPCTISSSHPENCFDSFPFAGIVKMLMFPSIKWFSVSHWAPQSMALTLPGFAGFIPIVATDV